MPTPWRGEQDHVFGVPRRDDIGPVVLRLVATQIGEGQLDHDVAAAVVNHGCNDVGCRNVAGGDGLPKLGFWVHPYVPGGVVEDDL